VNTNSQTPDPEELIDALCDELSVHIADQVRDDYSTWSETRAMSYVNTVTDILLTPRPPSPRLLTALVDDLVRMNTVGAIELDQWPSAHQFVYGWGGRPATRGLCECAYAKCPTKGANGHCRNDEQLLPEGIFTSPRLCMSCGYCLDEQMDER
jgi:hypothetical protein